MTTRPAPRIIPRLDRFAALALVAVLTATLAACDGREPDAYGNFEADEVTAVSYTHLTLPTKRIV